MLDEVSYGFHGLGITFRVSEFGNRGTYNGC